MNTLQPLARKYLASRRARGELTRKSVRSLTARLDSLIRSYGNRPVRQLGPSHIETWLESIGHLTPSSRAAYISTARGFVDWLRKEGHIRNDPMRDVQRVRRPRTVPRAITPDEVRRLLAVLPDQRAVLIVWLMVGCGLRCAEVARLGSSDYDERARTLAVRGKGGHERILPVPDEVAAVIDAYGLRSGPMIRNHLYPGRGLEAQTIGVLVSGWFRDAGIKKRAFDGRSAHALRHTAASDVLDRCKDVTVVQAMLGHDNVRTTSIYLRRAKLDVLRDAMAGRDYREVESGQLAA